MVQVSEAPIDGRGSPASDTTNASTVNSEFSQEELTAPITFIALDAINTTDISLLNLQETKARPLSAKEKRQQEDCCKCFCLILALGLFTVPGGQGAGPTAGCCIITTSLAHSCMRNS